MNTSLRLFTFPLILACLIAVNSAWAQDLAPPENDDEKKHHGLDSRLVNLYESVLAGKVPDESNSVILMGTDGQRVQVILEMVSAESPVPQNLGIEVETSYENLVQATVPVKNLEAIASDENVVIVRPPSVPVPAMVQPPAEDSSPLAEFDPIYILISAIAIPAIAIAVVWTRKSRK